MGILFANESVAALIRLNDIFDKQFVIGLPDQQHVEAQISNHADLSVFIDTHIVVEPSLYAFVLNQLVNGFGLEWTETHLICGKTKLLPFYPQDIAYNALALKNHLIHLSHHTDDEIVKRWRKEIVHVKQGYTRCTCLPLGKSAVITEDVHLAAQFTKLGYDVLKLEAGGVDLPGYPHGFIGGAGGTVDDYLVLNGSLQHHPESDLIKAFVAKHRLTIIELHDKKLTDCGSILYYTEKNEEAT